MLARLPPCKRPISPSLSQLASSRVISMKTQRHSVLASSIAGPDLLITATATGRCNLLSGCAGILVIDPAVVDRVNMVDEAITLATLAPFCRVAEREMTAPVSSTGYGENRFLDLCQSEVPDHVQLEMRQVRQLV